MIAIFSQKSSDLVVKQSLTDYFIFQEDVDEFMKQDDNTSAEVVLRRFEEQLQKFKFMDMNLATKKARLVIFSLDDQD